MLLNCDLGESFGAWRMPVDEQIMVYIDQASIACGYHAGDPMAIQQAISLAKAHHVSIGAHPSYPDLQGFGRRSMQLRGAELIACLHYQIAAVSGMAKAQGVQLDYVKPHGALYNDMMRERELRMQVMQAVATVGDEPLPLMLQALPTSEALLSEAADFGVPLLFEAFADRRYTDEGWLTPRKQAGAVLTEQQALEQVTLLLDKQCVQTASGHELPLVANTLCVHGDSPAAVAMAQQIRQMITKRSLSSEH